ncbi:MAG: DUF1573 domain-containing protein [Patescibacteria group bacterium]|nr:DUF1573 domain-containing protein [Patescibacteria group bacterium]
MKPQTVIATILACFVFIGLLVWGYSNSNKLPSSSSNVSKSLITTTETIYDFGNISMKNGNVTKEFTVTNPTNEDITISTVLTSCMCTTAFIIGPDGSTKGPFSMAGMGYVPPANEIIKTGESRIIRVVYDPNAHGPAGVGQIDRVVILTDKNGGELQLEIKAIVTP